MSEAVLWLMPSLLRRRPRRLDIWFEFILGIGWEGSFWKKSWCSADIFVKMVLSEEEIWLGR